MKKIINNYENIVSEMSEGLVNSSKNIELIPGYNTIIRKDISEKVGLVSGGGSGHEPAHGGFVGYGMLDAACNGEIFTSPTPDQILSAIKAVDRRKGVLLIIKNYQGDLMNFGMAAEIAANQGISVSSVIVNDDISIEEKANRRGIAGTIFVHKIAGAAAEKGENLEQVKRVALKVVDNVRSMGVALSSCVVPKIGEPSFSLDENEIELGVGIHGEKGISRSGIVSADEISEIILNKILGDLTIKSGDEVAIIVNGLGGTPLMELLIVNRKVNQYFKNLKVNIYKQYVGNYMTSLEMAGCSISVLKIDDELKKLLDFPVQTISFS